MTQHREPREAKPRGAAEGALGGSARAAYALAGAVTVGTAVAAWYAFDAARAGQPSLLLAMGIWYGLLAAVTLLGMRRTGELGMVTPRAGDLSLGAAGAGLLYGCAMLGRELLSPRGSPREAWIIRVYLQIGQGGGGTAGIGEQGDPERLAAGAAVFVVALLEEVVWRGLVMRSLEPSLGPRYALVLSSALFAAAHVPAAVLLLDPVAGPNPLLPVAGFACSLVWGGLYLRGRRLGPALFAHALFSWAVFEFPLWRP